MSSNLPKYQSGIFRRYFGTIFTVLVIPLIIIVSIYTWYEGKRGGENWVRKVKYENVTELDSFMVHMNDALTAFVIFSKSRHPLEVLNSNNNHELSRMYYELGMSSKGLSGLQIHSAKNVSVLSVGHALPVSWRPEDADALNYGLISYDDTDEVVIWDHIFDNEGNNAGIIAARIAIADILSPVVPNESTKRRLHVWLVSGGAIPDESPMCAVDSLRYAGNIYAVRLCSEVKSGIMAVTRKLIIVSLIALILCGIVAVIIAHVIATNMQEPIADLIRLSRDLFEKMDGKEDDVFISRMLDRPDEFGSVARAMMMSKKEAVMLHEERRCNAVMAAMGAVSAHIAHDMRTPLAVLRSYINNNGPSVNANGADMRSAAIHSIEKMIRMSDELIDYAKASKIRREIVDVEPMIKRDVLSEVVDLLAEKRCQFEVSNEGAYAVLVDAQKMERVLVNLVKNAIEAIIGNNGRVYIRIHSVNAMLVLRVVDNGSGIAQSDICGIFEQLFTRGKVCGTGLGLAYCKQVVEAHGGTIEVQSEVGKGSTFTIRIPNCVVKKDDAGVHAEDSWTAAGPLPMMPAASDSSVSSASSASLSPRWDVVQAGKRYLIIDDDPAMRSLMKRLIDQAGGKVVISAAAPDDVLFNRAISDKTIDAALVDYHFAGSEANGIDLVRFLKARGVASIHLCTGFHDDPEIHSQALAAGADSILPKPAYNVPA